MSDYPVQVERIRNATSLDDIQRIAREFSAKANGEGGILYSRSVGTVSSEVIAKELSSRTGLPIINDTPRATFLSDAQVNVAIKESAKRIFHSLGQSKQAAEVSAANFLYGDATAVAHSATSLEGCLWGEASKEFAGSLRGDVTVVASAATPDRVFGQVEVPQVLGNPKVTSLGGEPIARLQALYAQGGVEAVLPSVQERFIEAAPRGIFVAAENTGASVTRVAISSEVAATLGVDAAGFGTSAELGAAGLARAPTGFTAPAAALGESALAGEAAAATRGIRPGLAMRGLAVAGTAALAYDLVTTGHQVIQLESTGNATGAASATTHFVGRSAGGVIGGFAAGAGYGLVAGSETGPGALVTGLVGGVAGAYFGERWAQQRDIDRVFTQADRDGNEWTRNPEDPAGTWTRVASTQRVLASTTAVPDATARAPQADPSYSNVRYVAGDTLANELNYRSANASYELGLANVATPQDPNSIPPGAGDTRSADGGGNWTRNAQTQGWERTVVDGYIEHGMKTTHNEVASPQRAAELDRASALITAQNAANAPAAIAARYEVAYNQFGWSQYGEMPAAVRDARDHQASVLASDGHTYTRDAQGTWQTPGMLDGTNSASGNLLRELDVAEQSQRAGLQELATIAADAAAHPTLPSPMTMRGMVAGAYAHAGVARTEAEIDAATAAVERTHAREGFTIRRQPYALTLQPDPATGRVGPGSAIVTMMDDGRDGLLSDSRMVPKAITTAEEIRQPAAPVSNAPALLAPTGVTPGAAGSAAPTPSSTSQGAEGLRDHETALRQLPPNDQALFVRIRADAPSSVSDAHVLMGLRLAMDEGITDVGKLRGVALIGDRLVVIGTTPGFHVAVDLSKPAADAQATIDQTLASNQQRLQQMQGGASPREQGTPGRAV